MPYPIIPMSDKRQSLDLSTQDINNLLPLFMNPITVLQDSTLNNKDKNSIKEIWLKSESLEDGKLEVSASISDRDLMELRGRGFIEGNGRVISFTKKGEKILKEAILNDEISSLHKKASLFKKASKKLIAKNSYDFGDEVLIRTANKENIGVRYISISKKAFMEKSKAEPREIDSYKFATRNEKGGYKSLSEYSEDELVQVLHLVKHTLANHKDIMNKLAGNGNFEYMIPVHRIKHFSTLIMEELNSR